jgi:predicted thioesterase
MEIGDSIIPGFFREETFLVEEQHTAYHIGSGDEKVLGTPWMISFMERASNRLIAEHLPEGLMSVGVHVDVRHLAATPMRAQVQVRAEVLEVTENKVRLSIQAWDDKDKIGEGTHLRAVVGKERFMKRVLAKSE